MSKDTDDGFSCTAEAFEAFDDIPLSPPRDDTIGAIIAHRYNRRDVLKGSLGVTAATALFGSAALTAGAGPAEAAPAPFVFQEVAAGVDETHHVAEGYDADILIRWGDPLFADMAPFDPAKLTGTEQARRFGYNCDYIAFFPLDRRNTRGLLCINHEYANPEVMFPGVSVRPDRRRLRQDHRSTRGCGDGCAWRERGGGGAQERQVATRGRQPLQSAHHGPYGDDGRRAGGRTRADEDQGGSDRSQAVGHPQQLRRRSHALGHLPHGRGKLPRLLLDRPQGRQRQAAQQGLGRCAAEEL